MGGLPLCSVFLAEINEYTEDNLLPAPSHHLRENFVYENKRIPITTQTVVPAGKEPVRTAPFPVPYVKTHLILLSIMTEIILILLSS